MKVIKPNTLPTTLAGFARASTATYVDDAGVLQTAGVNVPRWERGRLLVEGAATNYALNNNNATPPKYTSGGADGTISVLSDPFWGLVLRITKTVGSLGARMGARWSVGAVPGSSYTGAIWIRRPSSVTSGQVYCDMSKSAGGLLTASLGLASIPSGSFVRSVFSASEAGASFVGGNFYAWVEGPVGDYVDVALPCIWAGSSDSSAIVTGASPATRAADVLTGTGLLYTTATDATPTYAAGTTYAAGAQVAYDRSRYQSLQAGNIGRQPDINPTWWARLGPANDWAMFDDQVSTQTVQATGPLRVALQTGAMDALAVLGVEADRVRLVVQDGAGGPVVYDQTQGMAADAVTSWFDYFFNDPTYRRTQALFQGIAPFGSSVATLTFSGSAVKVGHVSYGRVRSLGGLRYGARAGIKDFSRKDTDEFGVTTFVRRANSKYLTGTLEVEKTAINQVHNLLTSLTATPVVWIGSDDVYYSDTLLVYGFYRDFYASIDYPTLSIYSLEIEGLI